MNIRGRPWTLVPDFWGAVKCVDLQMRMTYDLP